LHGSVQSNKLLLSGMVTCLGDRVYSVTIYFLLCWYSYFQVSPDEDDVFEEIENMLQDVENKDTKCILPFPLLTQNAVESLRYRAQVWDE
jgi:hypothetical protein